MNIAEELKKKPITFSMDEITKTSEYVNRKKLCKKLARNAAKTINERFKEQCLH